MKEDIFINKQYAKKIVMYMLLFALICSSIILVSKFLTNVSVGADSPTVLIEGNLEKYINFKISDEDKGTLVQYGIETGIEQKEEDFNPLKESEIKLSLNKIDSKYPFAVKVIGKRTEMTNGKVENIEENYQYDSTTGTVTIKTSNVREDGKLINSLKPGKEAKDEYSIICYYDTYTEEIKERELNVKVSLNASLSEADETITYEKELKGTVSENFGELSSISYNTADIANGYIKSNIINGTAYTTKYTEIQNITISKKEAQEKIKLIENNTFVKEYQNENGEEITEDLGNNGNLVYKSTKIRKEDIIKLLGEDGVVEILDINENIITTIDKNTQFEEDGAVVINYENEPQSIIIKTSEIKNEGILKVENIKEIKSTMLNVDAKIKTTSKLIGINEKVEVVNDEEIKTDVEIFINNYENIITIKDAQTNIKMELNTSEWTNKQQNEVTFDVYVNANSVNDNMLKNPNIRIELPNEVEKVILGKSSVIYANGLKLQEPYLETNENGNIVIVANLLGTQTQYDENTLGLVTEVKISTTIILRKDVESTVKNVNLVYTNQYTLDGKLEVQTKTNEIQIDSYKEENKSTNEDFYTTYASATTNDITTEELAGLKLEVAPVRGDTTLSDGDTVYEGEFIKYNIKVTNTTDKKIDDIKVIGTIPEGTVYAELDADYYTIWGKYEYKYNEEIKENIIDIGSLKAGESINKFYEVKVNDLGNEENEKVLLSNIKTYVGKTETTRYEINNIARQAQVQVFLSANPNGLAKNGWNYHVKLISQENKIVSVKVKLPKEFKVEDIWSSDEANVITEKNIIDDNNVIVKVDTSVKNSQGETCITISGNINNSKIENKTEDSEVELEAIATAILEDTTYKSNENRLIYCYDNISVVMTSKNEGDNIKYKEAIEYEITIKNVGKSNISSYTSTIVKVSDYLPENVKPISMIYDNWVEELELVDEEKNLYNPTGIFNKQSYEEDLSVTYYNKNGEKLPNVDLSLKIPYGESVVIKVKTTAGSVNEKTKIENSTTVSGNDIDSKTSNIIAHTILPYNYVEDVENPSEPSNPDTPNNPNNPNNPDKPSDENQKYSISGVAWVDSNEDGRRQASEELLNGITVMLVNTNNSNAIQQKQITDVNGKYNFTDLEKGKYILVFNYDIDTYSLTEYQKNGIATSLNSDAADKEINLLGALTRVGLTDIISLDASVQNIDIGLIKNKICDLKLDKYISKVIVKTVSGTKEQEYDNTHLAKVEIKSKEIEGATVVIEYKIVVTNEGEIPTSVNKVIDYIPSGLEFSSELNQNWNITKSGEITNISCSNQKIEPGRSIELKLVLTKAMTKNTTGTFMNIAEIGEISNSVGGKDIDSIVANKSENEDDYSKAEIIISISTGGIIIYVSVLIVLFVVIGIAIKFGILKLTKISVFITMLILVVAVYSNNVTAEKSTSYESNLLPKDLWLKNVKKVDGLPSADFYGFDNNGKDYGANIDGGSNITCAKEGWWATTDYFRKFTKVAEITTEGSKIDGSTTTTGKVEIEKDSNLKFTIAQMENLDYLLGPFAIKDSNATSYKYYVKTKNKTNEIQLSGPCNEKGENLDVIGKNNFTFYLKISKEDFNFSEGDSIQYVKLVASRNDLKTTSKYNATIKALYAAQDHRKENSNSVDQETNLGVVETSVQWNGINRKIKTVCSGNYFQPVEITLMKEIEKEDEKNGFSEKTIQWDYEYGMFQIEKKDNDDQGKNLEGVRFEIQGPSYPNGKILVTDSSGKTENLINIVPGDYRITEIDNPYFGYSENIDVTVNIASGENFRYEAINTKQTGNLEIIKKDEDSGKVLSGVSFRIKKVDEKWRADVDKNGKINSNDRTYIERYLQENTGKYKLEPYALGDVNNDGKIDADDIELLQKYLAEEITVEEEYILVSDGKETYKGEKNVTKPIRVEKMEIVKLASEATIFTTDENGEINITNMLAGDYRLEEISVGDNFGYEVDSNYISYKFNDVHVRGNNIPFTIKRQSSTETDKDASATTITYSNILNVYNKQKYIRLSGYAWEDIVDLNKQTTRNYLYDKNATDKRLQHVAVTLVDEDGINIKFVETDENGQYVFDKVEIEKINGGGYIKFAYNGFSYQTVDVNCIDEDGKKVENGNTATEGDSRTKFNENYARIENNTVYKENGKILTNLLSYNSYNYTSTLKLEGKDSKYGYEGQKYPIRTSNNQDIYFIVARTEVNTNKESYRLFGQNKTIQQLLEDDKDEITNINIGLYEREQPDIEILKDLYDVRVSVNGYTHIYEAGQAINHLTNNSNDAEAIFNAGVKFPSGKQTDYENISYRRAIYKADYDCDIPDKELKVYATYVIKVSNTSTNLKVRVNEIMDYYHKAYTLEGIGTGINTETRELTGSVKKYTNDDENKTLSIELDTIMPGESMTEIYIQFSISKDKLGEFLDEATDNGEEYKYVDNLENIVEINSYSVFDENGKIYAGIDKDSNPGNADLNKLREKSIRRTEDDTSLAPGFRIEVRASREIEGTVFLDESVFAENSYETHPGETRNGNGIYEEGTERKISGVKVSLYKKDDLDKDSEGNYKIRSGASPIGKTTYNGSRTSTDSDGYFKISDFYPGDYNIVYTWGDKTYIEGNTNNPINVTDYKGTIYLNSKRTTEIDWYKDEKNRYSDAMDNYATRKLIDAEDSTINLMESTTPIFRVGIEKGDDLKKLIGITKSEEETPAFKILNVDFGITERARQELMVDKKINSIKITLANGHTIVDGQVIQEEDGTLRLNHDQNIVSGMAASETSEPRNGYLKAEIDSELIQGATAEIEYKIVVKNNSELDYDFENFYKYGIKGNKEQIIKITPKGVYDYLDNKLVFNKENNLEWEMKTREEYNKKEVSEPTIVEQYLNKYNETSTDSKGIITTIKGYETYSKTYQEIIENWNKETIQTSREKRFADKTILYNAKLETELEPNAENAVSLNVSKVLANTEDISLNNDIEITKVTRTQNAGRKITPVHSTLYNIAETVIITPPTGENRNYIVIFSIAISFLVSIGTGIIFIKKKVLR